MGEVTEPSDVVEDDPRSREILGQGYEGAAVFARMLAAEGELRGLIGPRELPRLWRRHVVNSAAVAPYLPESGSVIDVGSGAGLPGIVLALMRPDLQIHLVEPMQRRVAWLTEVGERLELGNVVVHGERAEDLHGELVAEAVTARAVAALDKLARWTMPMVRMGGALLAMKGQRAAEEVTQAGTVLRGFGVTSVTVHDVDLYDDGDLTRVVEVRR
ncbi:16S rRNA (guanine(527)-N(7))-methyltransferase RsmG [Pseudactinotalea suaedae]|uniref:16S rRNA (guanine(527)-N(7))-methyltransferase RsmG n=1 Tax=Pseudactinotalea suaedae TaxID=1524924 RepID=UPI0012E1DD10